MATLKLINNLVFFKLEEKLKLLPKKKLKIWRCGFFDAPIKIVGGIPIWPIFFFFFKYLPAWGIYTSYYFYCKHKHAREKVRLLCKEN